MTVDDKQRAREIFNRAAELRDTERAAYVERECGEAADLRQDVEALLEALHDASHDGFLGGSIPDRGADEGPSSLIGRYKILQKIGEGGFGAVYMAEQKQPIKRRVALKIIKLGMDTGQVIARFEAERQALAMMDHPNIAKVLDAGATEQGRPYFVMELVKGVPITEYCDRENVGVRRRLELFTQVCNAVQHAHQKGIIHRDITPNNVMVTLHDGEPVPKVIDFGIAKATDRELTDKTLFTEFGQFIGTPEYMAPEQAELSGLDIDTRADLYSLGVLLYELLTGTRPFEDLRKQGYMEMLRVIREDSPPKPSTRLSTIGAGDGDAMPGRGGGAVLWRSIRVDLDWIVMRALEKDRRRRYDTAAGLAADVERHLNDQPVVAGPPSRLYRLRKFARRNRVAVAAGALTCAGILAGLALAVVGFLQAKKEAENTRSIAEFYQDMFGSLNPMLGTPGSSAFTELTVAGLIRKSAPHVGSTFGDRPFLEAQVRQTFAQTLTGLGQFDDAVDHYARMLEILAESGAESSRLETMNAMGHCLASAGRHEEAVRTLRESVALSRSLRGSDDPMTIRSEGSLATLLWQSNEFEEAGRLAESAYARGLRGLGAEDKATLWAGLALACVKSSRGRFAEAEGMFGELRAIANRVFKKGTPETMFPAIRHSFTLAQLGRYDVAERLWKETWEMYRASLGDDHPWIQHIRCARSFILFKRGDFEPAEQNLRETLAAQLENLGPGHELVVFTESVLIPVLVGRGKLLEAEQRGRSVLAFRMKQRPGHRTDTLYERYVLGLALLEQDKIEEAAEILGETLRDSDELLPSGYWRGPMIRLAHARCEWKLGRHAEAEAGMLRAYDSLREMQGETHRETRACARTIAGFYQAWQKPERAKVWRTKVWRAK